MRYNIQTSEIGDFYHTDYSQLKKESPYEDALDVVKADSFEMSIKEWNSSKFKAQHIQINPQKNFEFYGKIEEDMVLLHFVLKGETSLIYNSKQNYELGESANSIFIPLAENISHRFFENKQYEYFKVYIPYDYINSMNEQNPEMFAPLLKSFDRQMIYLEKNCFTSLEMQQVIEQIKNNKLMGNLAPLYFENKMQELLLLQLQQQNCQECKTCRRLQYYSGQINEARKIIENQYRNPPTIKELALEVGMSVSVLKLCFKQFMGTTIYGYLFDYRMNIARKLLDDTSYAIADIAECSGYEHASHFSTAFKRRYGISPAEYRDKCA